MNRLQITQKMDNDFHPKVNFFPKVHMICYCLIVLFVKVKDLNYSTLRLILRYKSQKITFYLEYFSSSNFRR